MASRNSTVDIIRGFAILLVVLGHTLSGSTTGYENSFLFQVIWTLQMPLFICVSGYVTRYTKPIMTSGKLFSYIGKRSLAYLLPWTVWTFIVRGLIFGQTSYLNVKYLLWHMDTGYWFLVTIWCISILYLIADYISNRITCKAVTDVIWHIVFVAIGASLLVIVGILAGFDFLGIKLTLYYIPFYLCGFIYGRLQDAVRSTKNGEKITEVAVCASLALWLALLIRFNFFADSSDVMMIGMRAASSLFGVIAISGLMSSICNRGGADISRIQMGGSSVFGDIPYTLPATEHDCHAGSASRYHFQRNATSVNELRSDSRACLLDSEYAETQQGLEFRNLRKEVTTMPLLNWVGKRTLEVYLIHGFSLCLLKMADTPSLSYAGGLLLAAANFVVAVALSIIYIKIIETSRILNKVLYWK